MRTLSILIVQLFLVVVCFRLLRAGLMHFHIKGSLNRWRFAALFAGGIGVMVFNLFFVSLIMSSVSLTPALWRLGLGITLINAILAFPIALFAFRYLPLSIIDHATAPNEPTDKQ